MLRGINPACYTRGATKLLVQFDVLCIVAGEQQELTSIYIYIYKTKDMLMASGSSSSSSSSPGHNNDDKGETNLHPLG